MKIIEGLEIHNYKNIKNEIFTDFNDLNILIGPNNCGKSNILRAINLLSSDSKMETTNLLCDICNNVRNNAPVKENFYFPFDKIGNTYLNKGKTSIKFTLSEAGINKILPIDNLESTKNFLTVNTPGYTHIQENINKLTFKFRGNQLRGEHFSLFLHPDVINALKDNILYCPDTRLENYNGIDFEKYINSKKFSTTIFGKWRKAIYELVDPKIVDNRTADLDRIYEEEVFTTKISEQGSGVRALACLLADILDEKNKKILLIDEPELGLNPFAKQSFLKFLLEQSAKKKQIFLTTQDPTFINSIIWENKNVGLYLFSSSKQKFVKPDINQCKNDPDTSAGFLPHTISLKKTHLYLEGASDVFIFQIFLQRYLKEKYKNNNHKSWIEIFNKIGIYHLCGGFWEHLLYTLPDKPYKCVVILDGDKKNNIQEIIKKHNDAMVNKSNLVFCKTIRSLQKKFKEGNAHTVICLVRKNIERYLDLKTKNLPSSYKKRVDGPKIAEKIENIPDEIKNIFDIIIS